MQRRAGRRIARRSGRLVGRSSGPAVVHRGVPFVPFAGRTRGLAIDCLGLLDEEIAGLRSRSSQAAVNIYQTKKLASNPAPIATIHVAARLPLRHGDG